MKIKTKLQAVVLLPVAVFVVTAAIQYGANREIGKLQRQEELGARLSQMTSTLIGLTYEYGITQGERAASQWNTLYSEAEGLLDEMAAAYAGAEEKGVVEDLGLSCRKARKLFVGLLAYDETVGAERKDALVVSLRSNMLNRLILELQTMVPVFEQLHGAAHAAIERSLRVGLLVTVSAVLALAMAITTISFVVFKGITRSLEQVRQGIQAVAAGNLAYRIGSASRDEIGFLARGFDEMTERLGAMTVSRDELVREISERRLAEEALSASETQLKDAQRIAHLGSWELDITTNVLTWSDEIFRIFEVDQKAFGATYEAFLAAIHPEDRELVNRAYAGSLQKKIPYEVEHRLLMPDGRVKFVHERGETVFDANGRPLRSLGTVQDITVRKGIEAEIHRLNDQLEQRVAKRTGELEKKTLEVQEAQRALMNIVEDLHQKTVELEQANLKLQDIDRLKSMFIASMSHELRTPLNSIIGFSSIVLGEWFGPLNDEQKEKLAIVLRTGKHLLALINDLIDISKIEAGKLESIAEDFDLHDLLAEVAGLATAEAAAKGVGLHVEAIHLGMHTDRRRLYQCVVNLLGNAVKFTRQGEITVKAVLVGAAGQSGGGGTVAISVRDTGIGIRAEDLPKLFASFVRLPLPEDLQVKGTGLGLYLVKKIANEILRGTVDATSVHGQGSEFCLTVPVRIGEDTA